MLLGDLLEAMQHELVGKAVVDDRFARSVEAGI
jgi:hypothetical protein